MIAYHYETEFQLSHPTEYTDWIINCVRDCGADVGTVNYIFCSDEYLLNINQEHLNHDFYTDIITFQYEKAPNISGDIYISVDRVRDNAGIFKQEFETELKRVMIHGVLHLLGYNDGTEREKKIMRGRETALMKRFHVKH